jgi:1-phosphatidylinositol-4-phosphate 5-kinase
MNNIFCTPNKIDVRYDLKGSTEGRITKFPEDGPRDDTIALKDLDLLKQKKKFLVGRDYKKELCTIIAKDTAFFAKMGIIDYSLLIGIHDKELHKPP